MSERYGYHKESDVYHLSKEAAVVPEGALKGALTEVQRITDVKQMRKLDNETLANGVRCGVQNESSHPTSIRRKRYVLGGSRWVKEHLTYRISKYTKHIKDRIAVDNVIARALKQWSDASSLTFEEKRRGRVDIDIRFEEGDHGDGQILDGPGTTLAHAFYPQNGGDVHFDDAEDWTVDEKPGTSLFHVATHEFGHSLGLGHSDDPEAVMFKKYNGSSPLVELQADDIRGIQNLYGTSDRPVAVDTSSLPDTSDAPDMCSDARIDTATRIQNGDTYFFRDAFYWKIQSDTAATGYPRRIVEDWKGLEGNLDAAFTWPSGKTFFFKGEKYWRFTNMIMDLGYPKTLSVGFEGIPDGVDAAVVWSGNDKTYFFKGNQYWLYDGTKDPPVSDKYPKPLSNWRGIPDNIDAVLRWENQHTYFFKDKRFFRFNDDKFQVDSADPKYPRPTSVWWFHCVPVS